MILLVRASPAAWHGEGHTASSDQANHLPYILHGVYYLKDRENRSAVFTIPGMAKVFGHVLHRSSEGFTDGGTTAMGRGMGQGQGQGQQARERAYLRAGVVT